MYNNTSLNILFITMRFFLQKKTISATFQKKYPASVANTLTVGSLFQDWLNEMNSVLNEKIQNEKNPKRTSE